MSRKMSIMSRMSRTSNYQKNWYHIMPKHGIHDLNILLLMLKPNHVVIHDM
jgi:hypothetical protein